MLLKFEIIWTRIGQVIDFLNTQSIYLSIYLSIYHILLSYEHYGNNKYGGVIMIISWIPSILEY